MKILKWIVVAALGIVLITFAMANRTLITLTLFPLPFEVDISIFLLIFLVLIIGILIGGVACLSYAFCCLKKARAAAVRNAALEQEIAALKAAAHLMEPPSDQPS